MYLDCVGYTGMRVGVLGGAEASGPLYPPRIIDERSFRCVLLLIVFFWHYMAIRFLTLFSNMLTNLTLSDMETGYKVFKKQVLDSFKEKLQSHKFGIEPEITARIAKGNWKIYEVGISYSGRTYEEGKKINWKDGFAAIWHIIKFNIFTK